MNRFVVTISCIDSLSFSRLHSYSCLWDINSESMFGFLLTSLISLLMTKGETLIIFATSICYSFWIITMWTASTFWYKSSRLDFTLFRVSGLGSSFSSLFNSFFSFRIAILKEPLRDVFTILCTSFSAKISRPWDELAKTLALLRIIALSYVTCFPNSLWCLSLSCHCSRESISLSRANCLGHKNSFQSFLVDYNVLSLRAFWKCMSIYMSCCFTLTFWSSLMWITRLHTVGRWGLPLLLLSVLSIELLSSSFGTIW